MSSRPTRGARRAMLTAVTVLWSPALALLLSSPSACSRRLRPRAPGHHDQAASFLEARQHTACYGQNGTMTTAVPVTSSPRHGVEGADLLARPPTASSTATIPSPIHPDHGPGREDRDRRTSDYKSARARVRPDNMVRSARRASWLLELNRASGRDRRRRVQIEG